MSIDIRIQKNWKSQALATGALTVLLSIAGCSSSPKENANQPATSAHPAAGEQRATPAAVAEAGEYSENIYDMAMKSDWKTAQEKFTALEGSISRLKSEIPGGDPQLGKIAEHMPVLKLAIEKKERGTALKTSNQMTFTVAELNSRFNSPVPIEIIKLDYFGRELQIWAAEKDFKRLQETAAAMRQSWEKVRPAVEAKNGSAEAARFSRLIDQVGAAKTAADYSKLAVQTLDEVDNLEKLF